MLMLLLDSVSRQDFISSLPATSKFLEHLAAQQQHHPHNSHTAATQEGVSVFQFFRYHVVGGHTAPNVTPLFTGRRRSAWHAAFWQNNNRLSPPFIWRLYRELLGYETAFLQDGCEDYFDGIWTVTEQDPSPTNQEREKEANKEKKKKTETEKGEKVRVRDAKERRRELTGIDHEIVLPFCHPGKNFLSEFPLIPKIAQYLMGIQITWDELFGSVGYLMGHYLSEGDAWLGILCIPSPSII